MQRLEQTTGNGDDDETATMNEAHQVEGEKRIKVETSEALATGHGTCCCCC